MWHHSGISGSLFEQYHFGLVSFLMAMNNIVLEQVCEQLFCPIPRVSLPFLLHLLKKGGKELLK